MEFNLADLFEAVVDAVGDREAVVHGDRRFTYRQLDGRANRAAHVLADRGVGRGDRVALVLHNGVEYLELMLGAFKLGAVPVNVNYRYTGEELTSLFDDAQPVVVAHEPPAEPDTGPPAWEGCGASALVVGPGYEAALDGAPDQRPDVHRTGDDLYILYTGGTTGSPKGVVWRHKDILFAALGGGNPGGVPITAPEQISDLATQGRMRCLPASPLMHGTANWIALTTLLNGGTVVLAPSHFDACSLWELVEQEQVNYLVIVGDAFARPLVDTLRGHPARWGLDSLSVVLSGGAIFSSAVQHEMVDLIPWVVLVDSYGSSETGGQGRRVTTAGAPAPTGRHGFRIDDHTCLLDAELRPLPPGSSTVGYVARRGHIPIGYHGDAAKTAEVFPTIDGVRWAVPGDVGTVEADGTVRLLGRGTALINSGGEKVSPDEVEARLKAHPAVFDAVVVAVPDERWGEQVGAVVRLRVGHPATVEDLVDHCRANLAAFKVPRHVVLVDEVQRLPSGKPDHRWAQRLATRSVVSRS